MTAKPSKSRHQPRSGASQTVVNAGTIAGKVSAMLRERILAAAEAAHDECGATELSRVVAKRVGVSEAVVDSVIFRSYQEERRKVAVYRSGLLSTQEAVREASRDLWRAQ